MGAAAAGLALTFGILAAVGAFSPDEASLSGLRGRDRPSSTALSLLSFATEDPAELGIDRITYEGRLGPERGLRGNATFSGSADYGVDSMRAAFALESGPVTVDAEVHCNREGKILVVDGEAYLLHPTIAFDGCRFSSDSGGIAGPVLLLLGSATLSDVESVDDLRALRVQKSGSTTVATFEDGKGSTLTAQIDGAGRVRSVGVVSPGTIVDVSVGYGDPIAVRLPEATGRWPAEVSCPATMESGTWSATCQGARYRPGEFEVHVLHSDGTLAAIFPLAGPEDQAEGSLSFEFRDEGDAAFGAGDTLLVYGLESGDSVFVWDAWAARRIDDAPVPGGGLPALLALLVGIAFLTRRKR